MIKRYTTLLKALNREGDKNSIMLSLNIINKISTSTLAKRKRYHINNKVTNQSSQSVDLFRPLTKRPKTATIHNNISVTLIY